MKGQGGGGTAKGGGRTRSGGGTVAIQKTKARQTTAIDENIIKLRKAIFDDSGKDKDVCAGVAAFMKYNRRGLDVEITFTPKLTKAEADWSFEIIKDHMEDRYDASGYGWDDEDKYQTLTEQGARFLVIRAWPEDDEERGQMIGIAHFRFTVQGEYMDKMEGEPCLILWDLHVEEEYQRCGLGKHIVTLLELVARRESMRYISIPCMLNDEVTLAFVSKLKGYTPDASLRTMIDFDPEMEGFDVYSKDLTPIAPKVPAPAAITEAAADAETPSKEAPAAKKSEESPTSLFDFSKLNVSPSASEAAAATTAATDAADEEEQEKEGEVDDEDVSGLPLSEAIGKLQELFYMKHGREATEEEVGQWKQVLTEADGEDAATTEEGK